MLKIYRIQENAVLPKFATQQAACFDISSYGNHIVPARHSMAIPTGLILDIPIGYSVRVHPRSGLAYKKGVTLLNAEGIIAYNHAGNKIGVLVGLNNPISAANTDAGKDVAMQVAAMNPLAVDKAGVAQDVIDREVAIAKEKAVAAGKPANILDKIAEGAANTFLKENTLLSKSEGL